MLSEIWVLVLPNICVQLTERLYGDVDHVEERHRHRYEVNPKLVAEIEAAGLSFVGRDETGERMEITELKGMIVSFVGWVCESESRGTC